LLFFFAVLLPFVVNKDYHSVTVTSGGGRGERQSARDSGEDVEKTERRTRHSLSRVQPRLQPLGSKPWTSSLGLSRQ